MGKQKPSSVLLVCLAKTKVCPVGIGTLSLKRSARNSFGNAFCAVKFEKEIEQ